MPHLNAEQLESIRHLLVDPLRETIKSEVRLSHDRLASAIDRLSEHLATHIADTEKRVSSVEREVGRLRSFRRRVVAAYGAATILLGAVWSLFREKCLSKLTGH